MGKFVVYKTDTGYLFHLKAGNGETIGTSEVYTSLAACRTGIASVQKNAPSAAKVDMTCLLYTSASFHTFLKLYSEHIIPYMVLFCKGALARRDGLEYHKIPARKRRAGERRQSGPRRAGAGGTKNAGGYRHGGCGYEKLGTGI